jgi:hypothetical protein
MVSLPTSILQTAADTLNTLHANTQFVCHTTWEWWTLVAFKTLDELFNIIKVSAKPRCQQYSDRHGDYSGDNCLC